MDVLIAECVKGRSFLLNGNTLTKYLFIEEDFFTSSAFLFQKHVD